MTMGDKERGVRISKDMTKVTLESDFKAKFERCMGVMYVGAPAVFARFGFRLSVTRENLCGACRQMPHAREVKRCCLAYEPAKRIRAHVLHGMLLRDL